MNRYYIEYVADPLKDDNAFELLLFSLLSPDGIFTAQVGDAPSLNTAEAGNSNMKGRFDFFNGLRENGFPRIINYEEVCLNQYTEVRGGRIVLKYLTPVSAHYLYDLYTNI